MSDKLGVAGVRRATRRGDGAGRRIGLDPKQVVREGYDEIAERYLEMMGHMRVDERERYTAVLLDALRDEAEVLEIGCGAGLPTTAILAQRFRVTGVDISTRLIALAQQNVPQARFIEADVTQLDMAAGSLDAVAAFYSLIHIPRDEQAGLLGSIARWLRPGGWLVATMGTHAAQKDYDDFLGALMFWSSHDSPTNIALVKRAGFQIISAQEETALEFGQPVTFLWIVAQKLAPWCRSVGCLPASARV